MTWTTILDLLADLGAATAHPLWLPILAWTVLALPLWALLKRTDRLHPNAEYRLSQALLFGLPLGLAATGLASLLPSPAPGEPVVEVPRAALPAIELSSPPAPNAGVRIGATSTSPVWHWTQAVGLVTLAALAVTLLELGKLAFQAVAAVRVCTAVDDTSDESVRALAQRTAERLEVDRPVRVCLTSRDIVPITVGGLQPTILLPPGLAERSRALRMTLRHELVHLRRYDDLVHLFERVVAALCAAHPLVGRLRSYVAAARERACDAAVLADGQTSAAAYARLLAAFAEGNPPPRRLGALSLSESPSSLRDRLSAMRSSASSLLSSRSALGLSIVATALALTLGVVACTESTRPSTSATSSTSPVLDSGETLWTPIEDARAAGDKWLMRLNDGQAEKTFDGAAPMMGSLTKEEWTTWVEKRHSKMGAEQSRRFMFAEPYGKLGPSGTPSVRLRYMLEYESGQRCQPAIVMVLVDSSWKVGAFGPPCGDLSFPEGASAVTELSTPHTLPMPVDGRNVLRREITDPEIKEAIGRGTTIVVEFVVDEKGHVSSPHITRRLPPKSAKAADSTAIRVVRSAKFTPGRLNGEPSPVRMSAPVQLRPSNPKDTR